jgi:CyaY protein
METALDEAAFDQVARDELHAIEDALAELDPDDCEITTSDGILRLDCRDGTRIVINAHRAARQIWMAAVASAWHFDPAPGGRWIAPKSGDDFRATVMRLLAEHAGARVAL